MSISSTDDRTSPLRVRRSPQQLWLWVHRWLGLLLVVVFAALALTGTVLTTPQTFDRIVYPQRYPADEIGPEAVPSEFMRAAQAVLPAGDVISAVRYPRGTGGAVVVVGQVRAPAPLNLGPPVRARVWLHPQTAEVLAQSLDGNDFLWSMRAIHGHLLLDRWGRETVAFSGLLLLASAISGLWLWWPRWKHVPRALRWQRVQSVNLNLHRQGGALAWVVIVIEAVTGSYIAMPALFAALVEPGAVTLRSSEGPPLARSLATPRQQADIALVRAAALAGARPVEALLLPTERDPQWTVRFAAADGPLLVVRVDDLSGLAVAQPAGAPPGRADRSERFMTRLHAGDFGPIWRTVVFLSGLVLTLLGVTGVVQWWRGRARRARRESEILANRAAAAAHSATRTGASSAQQVDTA